MLIVIVSGALSILFPVTNNSNNHEEKQPNIKDLILIIVLGILGAIIIFLKIKALGWIGYIIAILGGLIIILLSWLILTEKEPHETIVIT